MFDEIVFENPKVRVTREIVGSLENNIYLVTCSQTGEKIAIDATSSDIGGAEQVLITHGHHDHITSAGQLSKSGCDCSSASTTRRS